jgi:alpha/beta superfamily hydrolase
MSSSPPRQERLTLDGPAGALQAVLEEPAGLATPAACMVVCHPHPLHGGTMDNKVVTTLARCAHELGAPTLRFNYRGVGASAGSWDEGRGETDDALAVVAAARQRWPQADLWLAGFSFGGVIALRASHALGAGQVRKLVSIAPALGRNFAAPADVPVPGCPWLIVQGEADDVVDPAVVKDWAARIAPAPRLVLLPGVGHFFHGHLATLQQQVLPFLQEA